MLTTENLTPVCQFLVLWAACLGGMCVVAWAMDIVRRRRRDHQIRCHQLWKAQKALLKEVRAKQDV